MMLRELVLTLIPVLMMVGLFGLAALWLSRRSRLHELAHRERLAMIERGLVPPVELQGGVLDFPAGQAPGGGIGSMSKAADRFRSAGVLLVGLGVAIAILLAFAVERPAIGVGVGGGLVALGAAMIINAVFASRDAPMTQNGGPPRPLARDHRAVDDQAGSDPRLT